MVSSHSQSTYKILVHVIIVTEGNYDLVHIILYSIASCMNSVHIQNAKKLIRVKYNIRKNINLIVTHT